MRAFIAGLVLFSFSLVTIITPYSQALASSQAVGGQVYQASATAPAAAQADRFSRFPSSSTQSRPASMAPSDTPDIYKNIEPFILQMDELPEEYLSGEKSPAELAQEEVQRLVEKTEADIQAIFDNAQAKWEASAYQASAQRGGEYSSPYIFQTSGIIAYFSARIPMLLAAIGDIFAGLVGAIISFLGALFGVFTIFLQFITGSKVAGYGSVQDNVTKAQKINDNWNATKELIADDTKFSMQHDRRIKEKELDIEREKSALNVSSYYGPNCSQRTAAAEKMEAVAAAENTKAAMAAALARRGALSAGGGGVSFNNGDDDGDGGGGDPDAPTNEEEAVDTARGPLEEITNRYRLAILFCSPNDLGGSADVFCPRTCNASNRNTGKCEPINPLTASLAPVYKHPDIHNLDVNYTLAIDNRRTWGAGNYYAFITNPDSDTPDALNYYSGQNRVIQADMAIATWFLTHLFREAVTPLSKADIEDAYDEDTGQLDADVAQLLLDHRSLQTYRSIAKNSFTTIISRKTPKPSSGGSERTLYDEVGSLFGVDVNTGDGLESGALASAADSGDESFLDNFLQEFMPFEEDGENYGPSYEAQLEFMAKLIYMNPGFLGNVEGNSQELMAATAVRSIVVYDLLEAMQRQEVLLATMLEIMLEDKHQKVEDLSSRIRGRN